MKTRKRVQFKTEGETMTKQSFKDECDINNILKKYNRTQLLTHVNKIQGSYGDFSGVQDYQTSLNQVIHAQDAFNGLPSDLRKRFLNDPINFIEFVNDPSNYAEAAKLGLLNEEKTRQYYQSLQTETKVSSVSKEQEVKKESTQSGSQTT